VCCFLVSVDMFVEYSFSRKLVLYLVGLQESISVETYCVPSCFLETGLHVTVTLIKYYIFLPSRDSAVGIATGCGMDNRRFGIRVPVGSRIITSPCRPDRLWGPPNLLYKGYRELFPGGKAAGA
jgi:hypothetical protein